MITDKDAARPLTESCIPEVCSEAHVSKRKSLRNLCSICKKGVETTQSRFLV